MQKPEVGQVYSHIVTGQAVPTIQYSIVVGVSNTTISYQRVYVSDDGNVVEPEPIHRSLNGWNSGTLLFDKKLVTNPKLVNMIKLLLV